MVPKTVAIIGAGGKTGRWAVKGGLQRGYSLRILARNPDKVKATMVELFGEQEAEANLERVTVVKGGVMDQEALKQLFQGADVVLSFLGMPANSDGKTWVVAPGVESILTVLKGMEKPPKLVSMSAMGIGDSREQGKRSHWFMGRALVHFFIPYFLKDCFADLEASEKHIEKERESGGNIVGTVIRAPILGNSKSYKCDFLDPAAKKYCFKHASETTNLSSYTLDRQDVCHGFLDCVESGAQDNKTVTIMKK